jgi:hypothetical protein
MSRFKLAALVAPLLMAATFATADVRVYVHSGPPRAVVERRPPSPGRGNVWIRGYHKWNGTSHEWVGGRWEAPPRSRARWNNGAWRRDRQRGWYYVDGAWR